MKKLLFLFLPFVALCSCVHAQSAKDSLYKIVQQQKTDSNTVKALIDFGDIILTENIDSAIFYYEKAMSISNTLHYWKGQALYYRSMAYLYGVRKRNKQQGLYYAFKMLNEAQRLNDENQIGRSYGVIAIVYQRFQEFDSCIYYYSKSIPLVQRYSPQNLPVIYGNMSNVYDGMRLVDKAIEYSKKAQEINYKDHDTAGIITTCINLASIYSYNDSNNHRQLQVLEEGISLAHASNNLYSLAILYNNMANYYQDIKQADSSLLYYNKALVLTQKSGSAVDETEILINIASRYGDKKDFKRELAILKKLDSSSIKSLNLNKQALFYEVIYEAYHGLGRYREAASMAEKILKLRDSINKVNTEELALEFDERLKNAAAEKQLAAKELKISRQKNQLWLLGISTAAILISGLFFYLYQRKKAIAKQLIITALKNEKELIGAKFSLEGQLNERSRISKEIHDELGASLTSISLLTQVLKKRLDTTQHPEINKIGDGSVDMVHKMNEIIWALNTSNDTIGSLVAYTRKFANNFLEEAGIELVFEEDISGRQRAIDGIPRRNIYLAVKEAINNVVKHSGASKVLIKINAADKLVIDIQDNGKGFKTDELPAFRNGLLNMQKRMEEIGGNFNFSNNKGALVQLLYNLKTR
jgi:signal transduction histidine kinase